MNYFIEGIIWGLTLAILLGPIFITIVQVSIEKGLKAGFVASSGIWISDFIIIFLCYKFVQKIEHLVHDDNFTFWMGLAGGFILIVFGLGALLSNKRLTFTQEKHSANDYLSFWLKGFLVNTVNPFTFVFWTSIITTYVIGRKANSNESIILLGTILGVIIATDSLKVIGAKLIRKKLSPKHFHIITKVAGIVLIVFGISLLIRTNT